MNNNKGFASTFILFSLLVLFLIVMSILLFTMNNSSVLNSGLKNKLINEIETKSDKELGKITVSLNLNGGTINSPGNWESIINADEITTYSRQINYEEQYGPIPEPVRAGYTFKGWYDSTSVGDVSISASSDNNNNYKALKYGLAPGATYTITMDKAEGTANKFTVRIFDFDAEEHAGEEDYNYEDYILAEKIVDASNNAITIKIKCPMTANSLGKVRLVVYAGEAGSTANQSMTFKNVKVGTMGTTTETKIENNTVLKYTENHQLFAKWTGNTYTVKAVASGGSITSTTGWTGTGETATKTITVGDSYGTLPTLANRNPTAVQDYTLKGWKSLPDGYIDLDYIEAPNSYYINTGYPLTNVSIVEVRYTLNTENKAIFGVIDLPGKKSYALVDTSSSNKKMYVYYAGVYDSFPNDITHGYTSGNIDDVRIYQYTNYNISTTSTKLGTGPNLSSDSTAFTTESIFLFGVNRIDNTDGNPIRATGGSRIYYFREYRHDDRPKKLIHYYVPCQRESDNALGMYDLVTDTFMTLSNTTEGQSATTITAKTITDTATVTTPRSHTIYAMW